MKRVWQLLKGTKRRGGQSLVEYALILTLVALVAVTALTTLGGEAGNTMDNVATTMDGSQGGGGSEPIDDDFNPDE